MMESQYGDYEAGSEIFPEKMEYGKQYFLFSPQDKDGEGWEFTFVGIDTSTDASKKFVNTKPNFTDYNKAYRSVLGDKEKMVLIMHKVEDGKVENEIKMFYNSSSGKWGKNPMVPFRVKEAVLTKQGNKKINIQKMGKFKDLLKFKETI